LRLRIENQLSHAFRAIESHSTSRRSPRKLRNLDFAIFFLRLRLRQPTPCDLRIGEHNRRYRVRFERDFVPGNRLNSGPPLMGSLVGQHRLTHHIADSVDRRIISLKLFVHLDEALSTDSYSSVFESRNLRIRLPSDRDENLVENLLSFLNFSPFKRNPNAATLLFDCSHRRIH